MIDLVLRPGVDEVSLRHVTGLGCFIPGKCCLAAHSVWTQYWNSVSNPEQNNGFSLKVGSGDPNCKSLGKYAFILTLLISIDSCWLSLA